MSANTQVMGLPARGLGTRKSWALMAMAALLVVGVTAGLYAAGNRSSTNVTPRVVPSEVIAPAQAGIPAVTGTGPGLVEIAEQSKPAVPAITGTGPDLVGIARLTGGAGVPARHRHHVGLNQYSGPSAGSPGRAR